jgi:hypothetical protein
MNISRIYCGKKLLKHYKYYKYCNNHSIFVIYYSTGDMELDNCRDHIYIFCEKKEMQVIHNKKLSSVIPIDPNLTPENFEQKIKLYLNFQ